MEGIARYLGSLLCHQLPDRTLALGALSMPVCARCEGLYLGFLAGLLCQLTARKRTEPAHAGAVFTVSAVQIAVLVLDGLASTWSRWDSGNPARLLLGLLGGGGISVFIAALFRYTFAARRGPFKPLIGWRRLVCADLVLVMLGALHRIPLYFVFKAFSLAVMVGIAVYYAAFNTAIAGALIDWRERAPGIGKVLMLIGCIASLFVLEFFLNRWVH